MPKAPPPVVTAGLVLVNMPLSYVGVINHAEVTFALDTPGTTISDLQDTIDDFFDNWKTNIGPSFDSAIVQGPPTAKMGQGTTVLLEAVAAAPSYNSPNSIALPPPQVAVLVKKTTGVSGQTNQGRTYFPWWVDEAHVTAFGAIDTTEQAGLQTHLTAFLAQLASDGTPMCIAQRVFDQPSPPRHVIRINKGPVVTSYKIEQQTATQRRRVRP